MKSWIDKRNKVYYLIKKISDSYGGDDVTWLRQYAKDVIEANKDGIDRALECFLDLDKGISCMEKIVPQRTLKSNLAENLNHIGRSILMPLGNCTKKQV